MTSFAGTSKASPAAAQFVATSRRVLWPSARSCLIGLATPALACAIVAGVLLLFAVPALAQGRTEPPVLDGIADQYRDAARLPRSVTVHSLRHACATEMLKGGANVRHVQEMLGHTTLVTTQVYTRVVPSDLKRIHKITAPSERRRVIDVPTFDQRAWRDKKNGSHG